MFYYLFLFIDLFSTFGWHVLKITCTLIYVQKITGTDIIYLIRRRILESNTMIIVPHRTLFMQVVIIF